MYSFLPFLIRILFHKSSDRFAAVTTAAIPMFICRLVTVKAIKFTKGHSVVSAKEECMRTEVYRLSKLSRRVRISASEIYILQGTVMVPVFLLWLPSFLIFASI